MTKKCKKCGAPIKGFWAWFSALAGVRQSKTNPDYCNKCVGSPEAQEKAQEKVVKEQGKKQTNEPSQPKDIYESEENSHLKKTNNQEEKEEKWAEQLDNIYEQAGKK